jgi:hypothetical protein
MRCLISKRTCQDEASQRATCDHVGDRARDVRRTRERLRKRVFFGGGGGIRTHGTLASTPVFKTGALSRSATPPGVRRRYVARFLGPRCGEAGGARAVQSWAWSLAPKGSHEARTSNPAMCFGARAAASFLAPASRSRHRGVPCRTRARDVVYGPHLSAKSSGACSAATTRTKKLLSHVSFLSTIT